MSNFRKHTFRLVDGDVDFLKDHYPQIPVNEVIRKLVHLHVQQIKNGTDGAELKMEKVDV